MNRIMYWLAALLLTGSHCVSAAELIKDGKINCAVVWPEGAFSKKIEAERELNKAFELICGQKPAASAKRQGGENPVNIHIGNTAFAREQNLDFAQFLDDGYRIKTFGPGDIVIAGKTDWGTLFGVNRFIEDALGVYQFWPGDIGQVYESRANLELADTDIAFKGAPFRNRYWTQPYSDPVVGFNTARWNMRVSDYVAHSAFMVIAPEKYGKDHPEYFPLIDGQRCVPPPGSRGGWQPCLSNPGVLQAAVEFTKDWFKKNDYYSFSFSRNDGFGDCMCAACLAMDPAASGTPQSRPLTDRWVKFCNKVMEEVAKEYPDKLLNFYAYGRTLAPPIETQLHPRVYPYITHASDQERFNAETVEQWAGRGMKHLGVYFYFYGKGFFVPRHYPHVFRDKIAFVMEMQKKYGLEHLSFRAECSPFWPFDWLKCWLASRILLDPGVDVDRQIQLAGNLFYGKAAGPMLAFFDQCEKTYIRGDEGCNKEFFTGWSSFTQFGQYRIEDLEICGALLAEARKLADTDVIRERIDKTQKAFRLADLCVREYRACKSLDAGPGTEAEAAETLGNIISMLEYGEKKKWYLENVTRKDVFLTGTRDVYLELFPEMTPTALTAIVPAMQAINKVFKTEKDALAFWQKAAGDKRYAPLRPYIGMQMKILAKEPSKIVNINPDVEKAASESHKILTPETTPGTCPPGWSFWRRKATPHRYEWAQDQAYSGKRSLKMTGCQAASFHTNFKAADGKLYRVTGYARSTKPDKYEEISVICQDEKQQWMWPTRVTIGFRAGPDQWTKFETVITPAKGSQYIGILLSGRGQDKDESIWYDLITVEEF